MTREDLIQAIADNLNLDCMSAADAALAALTTIEALGFVIVPRVPDDEMIDPRWPSLQAAEKLAFQRIIAGSPLYRDGGGR